MNTQDDIKHAKIANLATPATTEATETTVSVPAANAASFTDAIRSRFAILTSLRLKRRSKAKKDRLQGWDTWSRFQLWRHTRPLWGSLLMFFGSLFLLALPIYFLQYAFLLNSLWASLLLGGLLLVLALIQLFLPSYAVITGSFGIVISLVSFITSSFGGLGLGLLLGIIGSALSIAWRPVKRSQLVAAASSSSSSN